MPEEIRKLVKYQGLEMDLSQGTLTPAQIFYLNVKGIITTAEAMLASIATDAKGQGKCHDTAWERSYRFMSEVLSSFEEEEEEDALEDLEGEEQEETTEGGEI